MRSHRLFAPLLLAVLAPGCAAAQAPGHAGGEALPPPGYGSLRQDDLALRLRNTEVEIRFVPLDRAVTHLLARDAYESVQGLLRSRRHAIDSVASAAGVSQPGLALVSFFGLQPNARFDPQTLALQVRNQLFWPRGIVPLSPRFSSQQLNVREQVTAIYLYEETIPVTDDFSLNYAGRDSENWSRKQSLLDRERARVAARARGQRRDTTTAE